MRQIFFIYGGDSYLTYEEYLSQLKKKSIDYQRLLPKKRWSLNLPQNLPNCEVLYPSMPNSSNAVFEEWKIIFEKIIPFFGDDVCLVGHSLGAMFLVKYLNNNPLKNKVKQIHLVAGGYDDNSEDYGQFKIDSAKNLFDSSENIFVYHSEDDPVVPYSEFEKFKNDLPNAKFFSFKNRNHFLDEDFPELIENIKSI